MAKEKTPSTETDVQGVSGNKFVCSVCKTARLIYSEKRLISIIDSVNKGEPLVCRFCKVKKRAEVINKHLSADKVEEFKKVVK